ncbi:MAG TPA: hypothetical protein VL738_22860 [Dactylosporangium sp.]|jgi:NAD(P)-dependent dehydrogenase (short-subunit alcohol dehydrogenase family)|nr:hypothetical protein [Dactylosporangium sp.]
MNVQEQEVAVITGESRGLGAGLVEAYRKLGYASQKATRRELGELR